MSGKEMTSEELTAQLRRLVHGPAMDNREMWNILMLATTGELTLRLADRVAALEAERDRRENYEQEQNERR